MLSSKNLLKITYYFKIMIILNSKRKKLQSVLARIAK